MPSLVSSNAAEVKQVDGPLNRVGEVGRFLGGKAYDSKALRMRLADRGAEPVNPPTLNRKQLMLCDWEEYKARYLVENAFSAVR